MTTKHKMVYTTIILIYVLLSISCSKRQAAEMTPSPPTNPETPVTAVTYANFTQNLLQTRCAGCHAAGGSASSIWSFNGRSSVVSNEARIRRVVLVTRSMPLGGSLTAAELTSLQQWFDNNMPE
ncbi:hypothetical protein ACSBL2_09430 [Pedobacter sp. AW31-3R]|uniref:hypothetical protein n=1 Tax=Pedobacter sp. AW31-3R TaxID=3445781 RepID=UPI003FA170F6